MTRRPSCFFVAGLPKSVGNPKTKNTQSRLSAVYKQKTKSAPPPARGVGPRRRRLVMNSKPAHLLQGLSHDGQYSLLWLRVQARCTLVLNPCFMICDAIHGRRSSYPLNLERIHGLEYFLVLFEIELFSAPPAGDNSISKSQMKADREWRSGPGVIAVGSILLSSSQVKPC